MPRILMLFLFALTVGVSSSHAQNSSSDTDRLIGTWSGSYAGDGTGKYTMVLSRDADKKIGGTVETMRTARAATRRRSSR
jgi:hypothetical protein